MAGLFSNFKGMIDKRKQEIDNAGNAGEKVEVGVEKEDLAPADVVAKAIKEIEVNEGRLTPKVEECIERIYNDPKAFGEWFPDMPDKSTILQLLRDEGFRERIKETLAEAEDFSEREFAEYSEDEDAQPVQLKSPGVLV